ncbi:hypothetical protein AKJ41_05195 [candidate division MSBL1 archaeon SCGC-AAA259O05]|uniref:Uncharacterized protein n=1 Tax=candidate division MSBL1 archaeon SCGC-AAA259O05 TaxID=1698271 RepID=A0A133UZH2_9EURY|nr:hypothetical protein AKJ41_05195 [candidate division MSBL1 archaeon SCGC-AAA259O05]
MSTLTRSDYKPKGKSRSRESRSLSGKKANADKVIQMVIRGVSSEFIQTFRVLKEKEGEVDDLSEYLDALGETLEKPLPDQEEVERLVPSRLTVRGKYEELMDKLGDNMPEDEESRTVYARVAAGPEYDSFRKRAEEVLEKINLLEQTVKKPRGRQDMLILPILRLK